MDLGELVAHIGANTDKLHGGVGSASRAINTFETNTNRRMAKTQAHMNRTSVSAQRMQRTIQGSTVAAKGFGVAAPAALVKTEVAAKKAGVSLAGVQRIMGAMGILFTGVAIAAAIAGWVGQSKAFEASFTEVRTLIDETVVSSQRLEDQMKSMSGAYGTMADKSAALYQAISAGIDPEKAVAFLETAAKFSKAGVTSLESSVDLLTTSINSYGFAQEKASWVSDVLFETIKRGKTTADLLARSFAQVLGTANAVGVSFEELNSSVASLTAGGLKTSTVMAAMKVVFSNVAKPSGDAIEMSKKLGFEMGVSALKAKGFTGFLADLVSKTKGNTQAQVDLFGSVEAFNAIAILTSEAGLKRYTDAMAGMATATGNTFTALEKFKGTFGFEWERMWNNMSKSMTGVEGPLGRLLKMYNDVNEQSAKYETMLDRDEGINEQNIALGGVSGSRRMSGQTKLNEKIKKEFDEFTLSAERLNETLSKEFNKTGMTMEKMYSKYGNITEMLTPQLKKYGLELTDGMLRLQDYAKAMENNSRMVHILTKTGITAEEAAVAYGEELKELAITHKSFTSDALPPAIQEVLALAHAMETATQKARELSDSRALVPKAPSDYFLKDVLGWEDKKKDPVYGPDESGFARLQADMAPKTPTAPGVGSETSPYMSGEQLNKIQAEFDMKLEQEQNYEEFLMNIRRTAAEEEIELARKRDDALLAAKENFFGNLASLMNTSNKKVFQFGKIAAMAQAAMEGHKAVLSAYAVGMSPPGGSPMRAAAYALAAGAATANMIANIASSNFGGGGGPGTSIGQGSSGYTSGGFGDSFSSAQDQQTNKILLELSQAVSALKGIPPGQVITTGLEDVGGIAVASNDTHMSDLNNELGGGEYA